MKYRTIYIVMLLIACGMFFYCRQEESDAIESIEKCYDVNYKKDWNQLIVDSVNKSKITINVDNKEVNSIKDYIYMNENLNIMVPVSILTDTLDCAVNFYNNEELIIEKNNLEISTYVNSDKIDVNGDTATVSSPVTIYEDEAYASLEDMAVNMSYSYEWDADTNTVILSNISEEERTIPYSYDYRAENKAPTVKDQGSLGTCWAFAALTALESALLPERQLELSPDHMSISNAFNISQNDGGEYTMSMAYLTSWTGPVLEDEDPYGDGVSTEGLIANAHVQEIQIIGEKDYEKVKQAVYKYGGVQSSLYMALNDADSRSIYYNSDTYSYCYMGTERPNHDVVIIGWDDNYSKENFTVELEGDGAFICQNSWGSDYGDNGIFYVSYYDTNIGIHNIVYTRVDNTDNYNNIYQSDLCGWVGQLGYNSDTAYFSNVYTAGAAEMLNAVGFYATGVDTSYEIYIADDYMDSSSLSQRTLLTSGTLTNAGYYTIDLQEPVELTEGKQFAVIIKITTPNSVRPVAIEFAADEPTSTVDLSDGEGYVSSNGQSFINTETEKNCNVCLKVFTTNIK